MNLSVAGAGAMVIVNSMIIVKTLLGGTDRDLAVALACFGGGSMAAALALPRLLDRIPDRAVTLTASAGLGVALLALASIAWSLGVRQWSLLAAWTFLGLCYSAAQTPSGRLLRRSAAPADRPAVFAAQFALSHACWLATYPLAGWLGASAGLVPTLSALALISLTGTALAARFWPVEDPAVLGHAHLELPRHHPHLHGDSGSHALVIDDLHPTWP